MINRRTDTTHCIGFLGVLVALLTAIGYAGLARHGFVFDDHTLIAQNEFIRQLNVGAFFTARHSYADPEGQFGSYRPLRTLSFAVDYQLWGLDAAGFHLTNIALHALNAALVCLLAHRLTGRPRVAAIAALVFAFHPVQAEAVVRASCRGELLYSSFALLAFGLFWRTHVLRSSYILSLLCFCAALFSKEFAVMLPVLLAAAIGLGLGRQGKWTTLRL
ncbi:MAG: hypothetical protein FJ278_06550, partial [Planctomycetes bacterium]|nr:hypothetical protein [Planctomycetota bacterium]